MTSFADVMAAKTNGRRTATHRVCFSTEIETQYYTLLGALEDALRAEQRPQKQQSRSGNPAKRLGQGKASDAISEQIAELIENNQTAFWDFEFQALPSAEWRALRRDHAPRDDNREDAGMFNADTFPRVAIKACMIDPQPSDDVFAYLESKLSTGEWEQMTQRVWGLNEGQRVAPKLPEASTAPGGSNAG